MTLPDSAPATAVHLAQEMARATEAVRRILAQLAPGSRLELESVLEAFRTVQKVSEIRRALRPAEQSAQGAEYAHCESEYRAALEGWDRQLPRLHGWLLAERGRLGSRSGHVGQVRSWIEADQQTR